MAGEVALGGAGGGGGSIPLDDKIGRAFDNLLNPIDYLKDGENQATSKPNNNAESLEEKEKNVVAEKADKIKNNVKGAAEGVAALKTGNYIKAANKFKKLGPVGGIIAALILFAGASYVGNSLAPYSLVNVFQNNDPLNITNQRADNLIRKMMAPQARKKTITIDGKQYETSNLTKARLFQPNKFELSPYQKSKLKKAGFEIKKENGITILRNGDTTIVPDSRYADKFKGKGNVVDYDTALKGTDGVSLSLRQGTMTLRSRVRRWFDTHAQKLLARLGLSRNRGKDMKKGDLDEVKQRTSQGDDDADMSKGRISNEAAFDSGSEGDGDYAPKKGNVEDLSGIKKGATPLEIETEVSKAANAKQNGSILSGSVSRIAQMGCMASNIVGSVLNLMRALNLMQVRQTALQIFELIQKAQAGDNVGDSLNTVASSLISIATNTYKKGLFSSGKLEGSSKQDMDVVEIKGSAMQSNGIISKYEGKPRAPDTATGALNPLANLGELGPVLKKFGLSTTSFKSCASLQLVTSLTSIAEEIKDVGEVIACFSPAAVAGCSALIWNIAEKAAATITIQLVINALVSWLVPKVANWLVLDISTQLFGQQLGNVIGEGIMDIMNKNAQALGSTLATKATLLAYKQYERISLEENASYERATRSPFDPTSQYTFLGSLVTKLGTMTNTWITPVTSLATLSSTALSSLGNLFPHANAISDAKYVDYLEEYTKEYHTNLYSIGALAGDAFGSPIMIEDVSTLDMDPAEVIIRLDADDELDCFEQNEGETDVPVINQKGKCMEFIALYAQRESEFGVADMNIANSGNIEGDNTVVSAVVNATPVIGEVADIVNNTKALEKLGYVTGEVGVTKNNGDSLSIVNGKSVFDIVPTSDKVSLIQRFMGDQAFLEANELVEESSVSAALRVYYENHPLDNSFEGVLARKTGMTKENVEVALSFMKLASFVAEYEPSGRAPYVAIEEEKAKVYIDAEDVFHKKIEDFRNMADPQFIVRREYAIS